MPPILYLALQAAATPAAAAAPPPVPQRFSILTDPCASGSHDGEDIVVCGKPDTIAPRLPYPDEVTPDHPLPSNRELTGIGALRVQSAPCAVRSQGCTVGVGPPIVPMIKGAVGLAKSAFARKPDKRGRVAIPLDEPEPAADALRP